MGEANREMFAISQALNMDKGELKRLLDDNNRKLQAIYAEDNDFVEAVVSYVRKNGNVNEQAQSFYVKLRGTIVGSGRNFPDSSSALSRRLREEEDALFNEGISFSKTKINGYSYIRLEKIPQNQLTKAQKEHLMSPSKK